MPIMIASEKDKQNAINLLIWTFLKGIKITRLPKTVERPAINDTKIGPIISITSPLNCMNENVFLGHNSSGR